MTVFRFGGDNPQNPQWWIQTYARDKAIRDFAESVLGLPRWHEMVATTLINNPDKTFKAFLQEFVEEEDFWRGRDMLHLFPKENRKDTLMYSHGPLDLFKVGSYQEGCWIIASNQSEAENFYAEIAGRDLPGDWQMIASDYSYGHNWDEDDDAEPMWLPDTDRGFWDKQVWIKRPNGGLLVKTGEEIIRGAIEYMEKFPLLVGFHAEEITS